MIKLLCDYCTQRLNITPDVPYEFVTGIEQAVLTHNYIRDPIGLRREPGDLIDFICNTCGVIYSIPEDLRIQIYQEWDSSITKYVVPANEAYDAQWWLYRYPHPPFYIELGVGYRRILSEPTAPLSSSALYATYTPMVIVRNIQNRLVAAAIKLKPDITTSELESMRSRLLQEFERIGLLQTTGIKTVTDHKNEIPRINPPPHWK